MNPKKLYIILKSQRLPNGQSVAFGSFYRCKTRMNKNKITTNMQTSYKFYMFECIKYTFFMYIYKNLVIVLKKKNSWQNLSQDSMPVVKIWNNI